MNHKKLWQIGGFVAGGVLVVFGAVALLLGANGYRTVHNSLAQEKIVGSEDMTPSAIKSEAQQAGLPASISLPTCDVSGQSIDTGSEARCFAQYMRIHALEATGGLTYAQMGRYQLKANPADKAGTNDATKAATDSSGQPIANAARDTWVTENALATSLNVAYMAEQLAIFGIVVGVALLLTGVGFLILALAVFSRKQAVEEVVGPVPTPVTS